MSRPFPPELGESVIKLKYFRSGPRTSHISYNQKYIYEVGAKQVVSNLNGTSIDSSQYGPRTKPFDTMVTKGTFTVTFAGVHGLNNLDGRPETPLHEKGNCRSRVAVVPTLPSDSTGDSSGISRSGSLPTPVDYKNQYWTFWKSLCLMNNL